MAVAAIVVAAALIGPVGPAAAGGPVGGPRLGSAGVILPAGAPRLPAGLSASSWIIADLDTGAVLAARNPHGRFAPASTLKILTAETLIPRLNPTATIVVTDSDASVDGTRVGLVPRLRVHVSTLFAAMLVVSANDAALSLSREAGGTPRTIRAMDAEARRLGAFDTVPRTVDGLDAPGQSSSAYDLALIARAAMRLPAFRHYILIRQAQFPAPHGKSFQIYTHDKLLIHYPGAIGIKNGFTDAAKSSFVGAARRGGHTLVVALMHGEPTVWKEAGALMTWGFAAERRVTPVGRLISPGAEVTVATRANASTTSTAGGIGPAAVAAPRPAQRRTRPVGPAVGAAAAALLGGLALWRARRRTSPGR